MKGVLVMITLVAKLKAKPGMEKLLAEECVKMAKEVRANEKECLQYIPYVSIEDPTEIVFVEIYVDMEALEFHRKTPHMKALRQAIGDALAGPTEVQMFQD
jgi:quinol monooxygenase YgiN